MNAIDGNNAAQFLALYDGRATGSALNEAGAAYLRRNGLPKRDVEAWKYTDLRPLTALTVSADAAPSEATVETAAGLLRNLELETLDLAGTPRLVFVNGRFAPTLSLLPEMAGVAWGDAPADVSLAPGAMAALSAMLAMTGPRCVSRRVSMPAACCW